MNPTLAFPPATPFTLQASALSEVPVTIAAYCEEVPSVTLVAPSRSTVTTDAPVGVCDCDCAASATARLCEAVGLATLVAVIVTCEDCGALVGARYIPWEEIEPTLAFPPATPFTLQVTEAFELPVTVAAYCDWPPSVTVLGPVSATDTVVAESVPAK
jgi:hypothetical protein